MERWLKDGADFGWEMPRAAWWKRLPVIRHVRAAVAQHQADQWNSMWLSLGEIPSGYDNWVIFGIAAGKERPNG